MLGIIEQLYEDLNSYNETSIPIDPFNSIELKLLPFFPNPRPINDWEVPVPLIDLKAVRESNWDLTMIKVSRVAVSQEPLTKRPGVRAHRWNQPYQPYSGDGGM
jgi:hypothetical protein